jgi:hypothetical protein
MIFIKDLGSILSLAAGDLHGGACDPVADGRAADAEEIAIDRCDMPRSYRSTTSASFALRLSGSW